MKKAAHTFKKLIRWLQFTPVHPQWLVYKNCRKNLAEIAGKARGIVLDIGCGNSDIGNLLDSNSSYIGLDYYYTSVELYKSRPDVYGDACKLPVKSGSINTVLLLDVLEHLPHTDESLAEINRVLSVNGLLIMQVPYAYPLHDEPLDFYRWTRYGLRQLVEKHGFQFVEEKYSGNPLETSFLLLNLASCKVVLDWMDRKNPASVLIILLPAIILLNNITASVLNLLTPPDPVLPYSYRVVVKKSDA